MLEENIITFVKNELKRVHKILDSGCLGRQEEDEDTVDGEDEEQRSSREAFLKITLNFLRRMKKDKLAECLQSSKRI